MRAGVAGMAKSRSHSFDPDQPKKNGVAGTPDRDPVECGTNTIVTGGRPGRIFEPVGACGEVCSSYNGAAPGNVPLQQRLELCDRPSVDD